MKKIVLLGTILIIFLLESGLSLAVTLEPIQERQWWTTSARAIILPGETITDFSLPVPTCDKDLYPLVLGLHVAPEVVTGATYIDVVNLPQWAATLFVYQLHSSSGGTRVPLNVLGNGPEHLSAELPAGQRILDPNTSIGGRITLLGGPAASHRFEFNIHVTGSCGSGYQ